MKQVETEGVFTKADGSTDHENVEEVFNSILAVQTKELERYKQIKEKDRNVANDSV